MSDAPLLVNCTVPRYPATATLLASSALTVMLNDEPAVGVDGAVMPRCVVASGRTVTLTVPVAQRAALAPAVVPLSQTL